MINASMKVTLTGKDDSADGIHTNCRKRSGVQLEIFEGDSATANARDNGSDLSRRLSRMFLSEVMSMTTTAARVA